MPAPCQQHDAIREMLEDHESRLREKRDRVLKLEMEAAHMSEKIDLIVKQNAEIKTSLDSLRSWQLYLMGGAGAVALVYSLVVAHWGAIAKLLGPAG